MSSLQEEQHAGRRQPTPLPQVFKVLLLACASTLMYTAFLQLLID
jgi:hypothetical protein